MSSQERKGSIKNSDLPPIPEKLYFTIGEVGKLCGLRPHVLRYWEQEFTQLCPSKRRGNRRYYQRKDVLLIRQIRELLYEQGYTIEGARQQLSGEPAKTDAVQVQSHSAVESAVTNLENVLKELQSEGDTR